MPGWGGGGRDNLCGTANYRRLQTDTREAVLGAGPALGEQQLRCIYLGSCILRGGAPRQVLLLPVQAGDHVVFPSQYGNGFQLQRTMLN